MPEVHRIMKNKVEKKLDFLLTMKQGLKKKKKKNLVVLTLHWNVSLIESCSRSLELSNFSWWYEGSKKALWLSNVQEGTEVYLQKETFRKVAIKMLKALQKPGTAENLWYQICI